MLLNAVNKISQTSVSASSSNVSWRALLTTRALRLSPGFLREKKNLNNMIVDTESDIY